MSSQLGPLGVDCDAPPYPIVRASSQVGIEKAEDVRWARLSTFSSQRASWRLVLNPRAWKLLLGHLRGEGATCSCGQALPTLERYAFFSLDGALGHYLLGQCSRCRTVFWEKD